MDINKLQKGKDIRVNQDRLWRRLQEAGEIGRQADGVYCLALTEEENQVHNLLKRYMEEAHLTVRVDPAGNLIGRKEGRNPKLAAVMTGSHADTVYSGGIFDGRLGIIGGIEALQCMNENGIEADYPIEVCAYRDEEGTRFSKGYSGARFLTGKAQPDIMQVTDPDGVTIKEALIACGIDPEGVWQAKRDPQTIRAHVELHIEQGAVLESKGLAVGTVTGIFSQTRGEFRLTGFASHAGATPRELRKDPMPAAGELICAIEAAAKETPGAVATVGYIKAEPGGVNIIPASVSFSLDIRHLDPDVKNKLIEKICKQGEAICKKRGIGFETSISVEKVGSLKPKAGFDGHIRDLIDGACREMGLPLCHLPSGAGHDSGSFVDLCPTGMIFVRTKDGVSHNGAEYASPEDCALGAEVLMRVLAALAVDGESR